MRLRMVAVPPPRHHPPAPPPARPVSRGDSIPHGFVQIHRNRTLPGAADGGGMRRRMAEDGGGWRWMAEGGGRRSVVNRHTVQGPGSSRHYFFAAFFSWACPPDPPDLAPHGATGANMGQ